MSLHQDSKALAIPSSDSGSGRDTAIATKDSIDGDAPMDLGTIKFDPRWSLQVAPGLMIRRRFLPLLEREGVLEVAVEKSLDPNTERFLARISNCRIVSVIATPNSIRTLQGRLFGDLREAISLDRPIIDPSADKAARVENSEPSPDEAIEICDQLLKSGILRQASDIHFNVLRDGRVQTRFRIDGALSDDVILPEHLRLAVFNRIKVISGLDISEKRASQDGSFRFEPGRNLPRIEVRVATIPARHGERITLRLLSRDESLLTLDSLGFRENHRELFARAITLTHGMILLTGPTGSGKSTTLYAALKHLMGSSVRNVMTVEDPIEYEIAGVTQTEVDAKKEKVSFATSLRSILRHDPDVIMLGEIRDRETAELAVRAALTGHLVVSTLHTNTAAGAVTRLLDLGVDRFLIASVLRLVAAQRLVRELCPHCRKESTITETEAHALRDPALAGKRCCRASGCLRCAGTGYVGRTGLFEVVPIGAEEATLIGSASTDRPVEQELSRESRGKGHESLREDGIRKILAGETTVEDVLTATLEFA